MREIKFREWDVDRGTLSYGRREDFDDMIGFRFEHEESGERILEQYTGIDDFDGTPIYEGDIVKVLNDFYGIRTVKPFAVEPDNYVANKWIAEYVFDLVFDIDESYVGYELKVIGNIHEDKEFL